MQIWGNSQFGSLKESFDEKKTESEICLNHIYGLYF